LDWVRIFRQLYGLDWIGSMSWWIGLDWVSKNGPMSNSDASCISYYILFIISIITAQPMKGNSRNFPFVLLAVPSASLFGTSLLENHLLTSLQQFNKIPFATAFSNKCYPDVDTTTTTTTTTTNNNNSYGSPYESPIIMHNTKLLTMNY